MPQRGKPLPAKVDAPVQIVTRANVGRALANYPRVLLMDEPFGALDSQTRHMMSENLLKIWAEFGITVLFVTHDIDEAIFLGDRVLVMTARPGSVKLEQIVDLPRPRKPEIVTSPEFVRLKRTLLDAIEEESMKSFQSSIAQEKSQ